MENRKIKARHTPIDLEKKVFIKLAPIGLPKTSVSLALVSKFSNLG